MNVPSRLGVAAEALIDQLALSRHPEGGYFRETYRAAESTPEGALPARFGGPRAMSTAILFMLPAGEFSAFHRIASDEIWHFHLGDPVIVHVLANGSRRDLVLGSDLAAGQSLQAVVPHGAWFAARSVPRGAGYSLAGCTVAPGFDFADFALATRAELMAAYPDEAELVAAMTRT